MIKVIVTYKDGETDTWSTTLDYALHLSGSLLIDDSVDTVTLGQHS